MTYTEFCLYCRVLCLLFGCSETSGIRTEYRNTLVDGATKSTHQMEHGFGRDLVPDLNNELMKERIACAAEKLGLWTLIEDDHVHVGYRIEG